MQNYKDLLIDIIENGTNKQDRTGVGSRSVFGRTLKWNLADGFPLVTLRKTPLRLPFEETMFFLRGETNTKLLEAKNVNIWKGNTTREFLDKQGLTKLPEGDMGKGYSYQWRHWEGNSGYRFDPYDGEYRVSADRIDQIDNLLRDLKEDPYSRRHVVTAWNPGQLHEMALPPCHIMHMYSVQDNPDPTKRPLLHSSFIMRSNDAPFGLPFNIAGYAFLNIAFAKYLNYIPGELTYFGQDVHIYNNQMDMAHELIGRDPKPLPTLNITKDLNTFDDLLSLQWEDIQLTDYDPHPDVKNKPGMAI